MNFKYKVLKNQTFSNGNQSIVPIRMEDRYVIREWRNEQMFHLRQNKLLSEKDQDNYFNTVVKNLFTQEQPNQILFQRGTKQSCLLLGEIQTNMMFVQRGRTNTYIYNSSFTTRYNKRN